jgi:ATP-dependent RNA helicase RhlE
MQEVAMSAKPEALLETLKDFQESVLVFARTKRRTDRVAKYLEDYGIRAERIHGDRSQAQRQKAIDLFKGGKVKVLVATDIAARGLDIPLVELVINFDLPEMREDYVHRIGRTGRAGAQGVALSFVTPEERGHWAGLSGGKRGSHSRPAARTERRERFGKPRSERPAREEIPFTEAKPRSWNERPRRDEQPRREREERPFRFDRSDRREPARAESPADAPGAVPFTEARARSWSDRPRPRREEQPRNSRFQRWGQQREDRGARAGGPRREERPRNPNHIFTGREGDEQRTRGGRKPGRFGGHGHSAPPAGKGGSRGRWRNRTNADQPRG